jgi:hypothetical protein
MNSQTAQNALADAILASKPLAARYFAGFDDSTHAAQAPGLPNHLAWSLGHLALTMHRVAEKLDGHPIPASDIAPSAADLTALGRIGAFLREDVAFASTPTGDPRRYPPLARCIQIFDAACDRLAEAVRSATDAKLDESHPWGKGHSTLRELASRMVFHNGMHIGQIADLRRALKFKSVFA